ncbi:PREDICTED: uncharacterized protein LOC105107926 [Populus euphratica]|uniref:Uncharacterized protein LOC105107926 n=1 Tax=Populus euphratica TaxID=75702 RepID=A0AAJ6SXD0_POPEU|nr:PREDICTED: uncharacterized protein LOC105107926 [Populus euphratica]
MEATTVALWVERIAFLLLSCFTSIESCGFGWGAVLGLLALSNFLFRCAMEEKASAVKLKKFHKNLKNSDSRINIERYSDVKSNTNEEKKAVDEDGVNNRATSGEGGEDLTMKSKLFEILKKATNNCDAEKLSYKWQEMVVNEVEDEFKQYRALGDEELRKARGGCEEEFKKKLKIKEEELEAKHDEERRKWEKERKILKERYEMMRWT